MVTEMLEACVNNTDDITDDNHLTSDTETEVEGLFLTLYNSNITPS